MSGSPGTVMVNSSLYKNVSAMAINHACHMILNNCATIIFFKVKECRSKPTRVTVACLHQHLLKIFVMALTQQPSDMTKNYM